MTRSTLVRALLAAFATALFAVVLHRNFDLSTIGTLLAQSDSRWLAAGVLASILTTSLRAARLSLVVCGTLERQLVAASVVHNASTAILPMKLGEFVLPLLLARNGQLRMSEGLGILLVLRMLDLLALLLVGSAAIWHALSTSPGHGAAVSIALATFAAALGGTALLLVLWSTLSSWLQGNTLLARVPTLQQALLAATRASPGRLGLAFGLSLLVWSSLFLAFFFFSRAVGVTAGIAQAAAIGTAASLAFAFPISGLANVGPFQAAWVWMSLQLGIPSTHALAASLVSHGGVVLVTVALATLASPLLVGSGRTRPRGDA